MAPKANPGFEADLLACPNWNNPVCAGCVVPLDELEFICPNTGVTLLVLDVVAVEFCLAPNINKELLVVVAAAVELDFPNTNVPEPTDGVSDF